MAYSLMNAYSDLMAEKSLFVGITITQTTIKSYHTRKNALYEFLKYIRYPEYECDQVSDEFVKAFELWLKKERNCKENYFQKNLQRLKQVLEYAYRKKHIKENPLRFYKINFVKCKRISLTKKEVRAIKKHRFSSDRLQRVADLFLLQCYTGLAYADLMGFDKSKHLHGQTIVIDRQKTDEGSTVPLNKKSKKIFKKYKFCVPVISNQNYNSYLKEVADIVGIKKKLTTHVGRKTFGQLYLDNGASMEVVSAMLGHSNTRITQSTYAKVSEARIRLETKEIRI